MQKITEKITVAGHTAELMGYTIEKKNDWGVQDTRLQLSFVPVGVIILFQIEKLIQLL